MSYNLVDPTTGDLTRVAGNSNIVDTAIETTSTWSSSKIYSAINSIGFKGDAPENANSATTPGVYLINRNDDAYPVRQGYLIVSKPRQDYDCILQEVYYFNANKIYSRGCWFNSWYDWQQLVTNDDIFLVGDRRNTIGWADLSNSVDVDGSSNFANNVGRVEGHNALIKVSNPSTSYQWPVTNSGDNNVFMDFGGAIQFFTDRVNNHLYVRFADSVDMSAWGELATMDKVNALHKQTVGYIEGSLLSSAIESANLYYQKFGDNRLVINGWISLGSAVPTQGTKIFTLPNGWKVDSNYLLPCYTPNSNSAYACMIDISTSDVKSYTPLPSGMELRFCADIYLA